MRLLITQRVRKDEHAQMTDVLEAAYTEYLSPMGYTLIPVSNFLQDLDGYLQKVQYDALVVSGGGDVDRPKFGDAGLDVYPERDKTCLGLIEHAIENHLPVLGICYGMQLLNTRFGGDLTVNVHTEAAGKAHRQPGHDHEVIFTQPTFGVWGLSQVNHYHNHGIRTSELADDLDAFASDQDHDIVEGFRHKSLPVMGIQWHPERKSPDTEMNEKLINGFFGQGDLE